MSGKGLLLVCGGSWLDIKLMKLALLKPFRFYYSLGRPYWTSVAGKPVSRCLRVCVKETLRRWLAELGDGEEAEKTQTNELAEHDAKCPIGNHHECWAPPAS